MTALPPPELVEHALAKEPEPHWKHNWMYGFSPASATEWNQTSIGIWMVGYCKNCDKLVSVPVPISTTEGPYVTEAGIPKWGCVGPQT